MGLQSRFLAHGETPTMKRLLRNLARVAAGAVILGLLAVAAIYIASEGLIRRSYDVALVPVVVPTDATSIAEGRRLATIRGCNDGCHGKGVSGGMLFDGPWYYGDMVAPDLSRVAASHTDAELARVIRHGVRRNGRSTFGMPSSMFFHLTDADLGVIIAFLRSLPVGNGPDTAIRFGPLGRLELVMKPHFAYATEIERDAPWATEAELQGSLGRGRYLALTVCSECHGMNLKGSDDGSTPDLVAVGAYAPEQFARFMREGIAVGERELPFMSRVARERFSVFRDDEVRALYDFLSARARDPRSHE
jgi:mono/diheme cytochrome c family protein